MSAMDARMARIARILEAYDAQGWHRTGTAVDAASTEWFVESIRKLGADPSLEEFALERFDPLEAAIQVGGRRFEGLPLFDAPAPPGGAIRGALGPLGSGSPIGLTVARSPVPDPEFDAIRGQPGHKALVAVTVGTAPGLQARNTHSFRQPFGVPVLQVGSEAEAALQAAAATGADATFTVSIRRTPVRTANLVVRVPGRNPGLPSLVVSTPRTGWWNCSGERGGGIACWFELLRSALRRPHLRDTVFVAFSGHELNFLGAEAYLEQHPVAPVEAHAWVHFGANVGAAQGAAVRVSASRPRDLKRARAALERESVGEVGGPPAGTVGGGESAIMARLGARCIAVVGGNNLFHYESDRWPANNDVRQVARHARAFTTLVRRIAAEPVPGARPS